MARMHDLYAVLEGMEADIQWIVENSTDKQKEKLYHMTSMLNEYGLTPEEARKFWARKYDKAVYNSPRSRRWREARRKPTPTGEGWDPEHQLGTVSAHKSKKGSK